MRKIVNFRAPLFVAIGLILGILSFYEFLFGNFWLGLAVIVVIFAIGVALFVLKSKTWIGILVILVTVVLGFFLSQLNYHLLTKDEVTEHNALVTGRVCDLDRNGSDGFAYYLEDCVDSDGLKYGGRVKAYIFDGKYQTGEVITVRGTINSVYPVQASVNSYYLRHNVCYEIDVDLVAARFEGRVKLDETIRKYIYDTASKYGNGEGDVLYSLLTGDRSALSDEKESDFKAAGIIHLLAVSGLHVGFVVAVFSFVLRRLKLHPLIELAIIIVPLIFYAYICNFTPSIIRAIVMVACVYLARAVFGRYDLLTSLSLAVITILIVSPFNLFDVGFQLSALSVYGIATLFTVINRRVEARKLPRAVKYILNSLAVSLSCSVATFFTLQLNYGYAPVMGIALNIFVIPLVSVAFVICWIGLLPWFFHYIMYLAGWIFDAVGVLAKWIASLSFATATVPAIVLTTVVVVMWLFVLGGYVNLRKIGKIITNVTLAAILALCVGLSFVRLKPQEQFYVTFGYNDVMTAATSASGEAVIVGNFGDAYAYNNAVNYLNKYKITNCVLYITAYGECNSVVIEDALNQFPVNTVYKLDFSFNATVDAVFENRNVNVYQQMENTSSGDNITVTSVYDGGLRAVIVRTATLVGTSVYGNDYAIERYLDLGVPSDVYVLPRANKTYSSRGLFTLSYYQSQLPLNYGANKYGTFTITQKGDTIGVKFR